MYVAIKTPARPLGAYVNDYYPPSVLFSNATAEAAQINSDMMSTKKSLDSATNQLKGLMLANVAALGTLTEAVHNKSTEVNNYNVKFKSLEAALAHIGPFVLAEQAGNNSNQIAIVNRAVATPEALPATNSAAAQITATTRKTLTPTLTTGEIALAFVVPAAALSFLAYLKR